MKPLGEGGVLEANLREIWLEVVNLTSHTTKRGLKAIKMGK